MHYFHNQVAYKKQNGRIHLNRIKTVLEWSINACTHSTHTDTHTHNTPHFTAGINKPSVYFCGYSGDHRADIGSQWYSGQQTCACGYVCLQNLVVLAKNCASDWLIFVGNIIGQFIYPSKFSSQKLAAINSHCSTPLSGRYLVFTSCVRLKKNNDINSFN